MTTDFIQELLGYLNFSDGTPQPGFRSACNKLFSGGGEPPGFSSLAEQLRQELRSRRTAGIGGFDDISQADEVITVALDLLPTAYREHHADLLFHLNEEDFRHPFLVARFFETVLAARANTASPSNHDEILHQALQQLNDYVGYRPVAVLENGRRAEVYDRERFCPVPLYFEGAGVAEGPYRELITATLNFLRTLPEELTAPSHFSAGRMTELSLDVRAHDHLHPVNKRTNYLFGEWDPEFINTKGYYHRFIVRRIILDSLNDWIARGRRYRAERLEDASAVLAGTMLMASAISGSGPQTYSSDVSLTTLLPLVARHRDRFYQALTESADGPRRKRLEQHARKTRQPFGHVRHELNLSLSGYGAAQMQHRQLSWLYANMGYEQDSLEEAAAIPCPSARFESELQSQIVRIRRACQEHAPETARDALCDLLDLYDRGIRCGALVDPWNILGFQGQFPLFSAREDTIPDQRVEVLIELTEQIFQACAQLMTEASAAGRSDLLEEVRSHFTALAERWDRYATSTVTDLPKVMGMESVRGAEQVAETLAKWKQAGSATGDIRFWREHVDSFESAGSYAQVAGALLDRQDYTASMGLLMQWLSECETTGTGGHGPQSIYFLMLRLARGIHAISDSVERWTLLRRLVAFMEANAGEMWDFPRLREFTETDEKSEKKNPDDYQLDHLFEENGDPEEEDQLFSAAYEDVVYRDSTDDGNDGDTLDEGTAPGNTEFEQLFRQLEPQVRFQHTIGCILVIAGSGIMGDFSEQTEGDMDQSRAETLEQWLQVIRGKLRQCELLIEDVSHHEIQSYSSELDANIEFDMQSQARFTLMQNLISTALELLLAERLVETALPPSNGSDVGSFELSAATDLVLRQQDLDSALNNVLRTAFRGDREATRRQMPELRARLAKQPLLYVPFENGGDPVRALKARLLQSVIRVLLSLLPRLGLLDETFALLQTAMEMERVARPIGQSVTEFDRLFRLALTGSVSAVIHAAPSPEERSAGDLRRTVDRLERLLEAFTGLWNRHNRSMRLSIVEDLHSPYRAREVKDFIERYGQDLFHTRMLTLGNARAIVQAGADALISDLQEGVLPFEAPQLIEDIQTGVLDEEAAADLIEFVYECVVDNFDRFLEYNTTTTHSDYGNQLYCLLDFLRVESMYDRYDWSWLPWQIAYASCLKQREDDIAAELASMVRDATSLQAENYVKELSRLERRYGVRLPGLHDHIHNRIVGKLQEELLSALVGRSVPSDAEHDPEILQRNFTDLRKLVSDFMADRMGSGIDAPAWMQNMTDQLEAANESKAALTDTFFADGEYLPMSNGELESQLQQLDDSETE